jgi:hypothetical protein
VRRIKILSRALWGLNALLTTALIAFTGRYLVAPPKVDHLRDLPLSEAARSPRPAPEPPPSEEAMATLPNPLGPRAATPLASSTLALKGALPAEHGGIAFIRVDGTETIAGKGDEVHGWRLTDLWKDRATFTSPSGRRTEVVIEPFSPPVTHR